MSQQLLKMKYHPAKKEVLFTRLVENGSEMAIPTSSKLGKYMGMKGTFVLQNFGNTFFDDIADAFDGLDTLNIEVITTKLDYEDFVQMVERYNLSGRCKLTPNLLAELPDMDVTFQQVKQHGEESIGILKAKSKEFYEIDLSTPSVRQSADCFVKQVNDEAAEIREKISTLNDNNVSLCFTGVYSSGKSSLINAILGYKILPESIKSETAKMFIIRSPGQNEPVMIKFDIPDGHCELEWNEQNECFEFATGPSENSVRTHIQAKINDFKGTPMRQHEQVEALLKLLNDNPLVSPEIDILFPVSLDSKTVQFTIYDTPGTDSNYMEHRAVLANALESQQQSILIFVAKPNGLEGEGNNALLNYLKEAEEKSSKTSIDMGRSLFVINLADSVPKDQRISLQTQMITNKEDKSFSIKLEDKKLFFTSALYAYKAKAITNGIATQDDINYCNIGTMLLTSDGSPFACCFRQDRCATSELATERMIAKSEQMLKEALENGSTSEQIIISSGLYALEEEIRQYGEKFASATRAFAIINSVDKALSKLNDSATSIQAQSNQEIADIEKEIHTLKDTITTAIDNEYGRVSLRDNGRLPSDMSKRLFLDDKSLDSRLVGAVTASLQAQLKGWFFGHGKVKFKKSDRDMVDRCVKRKLTEYRDNFLNARKDLLEEQGKNFMDAIKEAIRKNGDISESAKQEFLTIPSPQVGNHLPSVDITNIYDEYKQVSKFFKMESLDKEGFLHETEGALLGVARKMADDFKRDYLLAHEAMLNQVKNQFDSNLEQYSLKMKALSEDKVATLALSEKVAAAAAALRASQERLNNIIWEEKKR